MTSDTPPAAVVDEAYTHTIASEDVHPNTFTITAGELPEGLTLDENTGEIAGTPTTEQTTTATITVANAGHATDVAYDFDVRAAVITPEPTPSPSPGNPGEITDPATQPGKSNNGALASTGFDGIPLFLIATLILLAGATTIVITHARRKHATVSAEATATDS